MRPALSTPLAAPDVPARLLAEVLLAPPPGHTPPSRRSRARSREPHADATRRPSVTSRATPRSPRHNSLAFAMFVLTLLRGCHRARPRSDPHRLAIGGASRSRHPRATSAAPSARLGDYPSRPLVTGPRPPQPPSATAIRTAARPLPGHAYVPPLKPTKQKPPWNYSETPRRPHCLHGSAYDAFHEKSPSPSSPAAPAIPSRPVCTPSTPASR